MINTIKYNTFLQINKDIYTGNGKLIKRKIKKDYYNVFFPALINYNSHNINNKITITSLEYEEYFDEAVKTGKFIGKCSACGYRINY